MGKYQLSVNTANVTGKTDIQHFLIMRSPFILAIAKD